ncbi:hypothetical protein [Parvibacter caecicola]|uniref:Uncharacterized protein n=1 Tax=Parvibacter caecicola TaxID=747645 RepID=A0A4T9T8I8_9ACTN|nr:hypothetical protein [Parvibacter caecicola]TJW11359.1 hypothetical protein E5982_03900 [Parvibacter caecicola]
MQIAMQVQLRSRFVQGPFVEASLIVVLCGLFVFLLPTSYNGDESPILQNAIYSIAFALVLLLLLLDKARFEGKRLLMAAALFLYLLIASIFVVGSGVGRFSLARLVPIVLTALLFSLCFKKRCIGAKFATNVLDLILIVIIVWNVTAMAHIAPFEQFVRSFYTQLDDYTATTYSLLIGKPVFTFGVHNFAAAFYAILFLLCAQVYFVLNRKRMLLYAVALLFFTLLLKSAASYASLGLMVTLFILSYYHYRETKIPLFIPILIACALGTIFLVAFPQVVERLFFSTTNGFGSRYLASGLYSENYRIVESFPMGTGYSIVDGLWYADSGFIVYLTMGGVLCFALLVPLFWGYCKDNIPDPFIRCAFVAVIFVCELSFPSFIYWKMMFCYVFFALISAAISCSSELSNAEKIGALKCDLGANG